MNSVPLRISGSPAPGTERRTISAARAGAGNSIQQHLPHRLVAMQSGRLVEERAAEQDRVAKPVIVAAHLDQGRHGRDLAHRGRVDARLVAQEQHERVAGDPGDRGADR